MMNLNKLLIDLMRGKAVEVKGSEEEIRSFQEKVLRYMSPIQSLLRGKVTTRKAEGCLYVWLDPEDDKSVRMVA